MALIYMSRALNGEALELARILDMSILVAHEQAGNDPAGVPLSPDDPRVETGASLMRRLFMSMFAGKLYKDAQAFFQAASTVELATLIEAARNMGVASRNGRLQSDQLANLTPAALRAVSELEPATFEDALHVVEATRVYLWLGSNRTKLTDTYGYNLVTGGSVLTALPVGIEDNKKFAGYVTLEILNNFVTHILTIKSALVKMKTPKQLLEMADRVLDDLLSGLGSQLNPARLGDVTRYLGDDVPWSAGAERRQIAKARDNVTQFRIGANQHRLYKFHAVPWDTSDEALDRGEIPLDPRRGVCQVLGSLWEAMENYRKWAAGEPFYKADGSVNIWKVVSLWQLHAYYIRNDLRLMDLNEFSWVAMIVETMADTMTKVGPIPTEPFYCAGEDHFEMLLPFPPGWTNGGTVSTRIVGPTHRLNEIFFYPHVEDGSGSREQLPSYRADSRVFQRIALSTIGTAREGLARDTFRNWARELFAEAILNRGHIQDAKVKGLGKLDPWLIDARIAQAVARMPGETEEHFRARRSAGAVLSLTPGETQDDYRRRLPRTLLRRGRADLFAHWHRRVDYLLMNAWAERIHPLKGFRSVKWQYFMDHMYSRGFGAGYGNQEESLKIIEDIGTLSLIIGIYDDFVAGLTEEEIFMRVHLDENARREAVGKALRARNTLLFLADKDHASDVGSFHYREDTVKITYEFAGEALNRLQLANRQHFLAVKAGAIDPGRDKMHRITRRILAGSEERSDIATFESQVELTGALLGWIWQFTHGIFNWDIPFAAYFAENKRTLYRGEGTIDEYYARHYVPRLKKLHKEVKEFPPVLKPHNVKNMPTPIWDWLFLPLLSGRRPILIPRCSLLNEFIEGED